MKKKTVLFFIVFAVCILFAVPVYAEGNNTYQITANTYAPFSEDGSDILVQTTGQYTKSVSPSNRVNIYTGGGNAGLNDVEYRKDNMGPNIAKCARVTATINGGPVIDYTGNPYIGTGTKWKDEDGNPMLAVADLEGSEYVYSPVARFDASTMEDGSSIVVNFYYEYTDQEKEYSATNIWEFYDASGTSLISKITRPVMYPKPGKSIKFESAFEKGVGYYQLDGYRMLRWTQSVKLIGGTSNPIIGSVNDYEVTVPPVKGKMLHDDVSCTYTLSLHSIPITIDLYLQQPDGSYKQDTDGTINDEFDGAKANQEVDISMYKELYPDRDGYTINTDKSLIKQKLILTDPDPEHFKIYYDLKNYSLTVRFVDENNKDLADPVTGEYQKDQAYNIPAPTVDGYTPEVPNISGTMPGEPTTLFIHYTKNTVPEDPLPDNANDSNSPVFPNTGNMTCLTESIKLALMSIGMIIALCVLSRLIDTNLAD